MLPVRASRDLLLHAIEGPPGVLRNCPRSCMVWTATP